MKKQTILLLVLTLVIFSCKNKETKEVVNDESKLTIITGKIESASDKRILVTYNLTTDTILLDDNSSFTAKILLNNASHIVITNGQNHARIYVNPKSKINFEANSNRFLETISFSGDDVAPNTYLAKQVLEYRNAGVNTENFLYAGVYETFKNSLEDLSSRMEAHLEDFISDEKGEYDEFVQLEKDRIKLIKASLFLVYYNPIVNTDKKSDSTEKEIEDLISGIDINNPMMIQLQEFYPFVQLMVSFEINKKSRNENKKYNDVADYSNDYFEIIKTKFVEASLLEDLYYLIISDFVAYYGADGLTEIYADYKTFATNKSRLSELDKIFEEFNKLAPGQSSVEWSFPDANGKYYSSSDFRGKYLYIDVWASWCGPCLREIPFLKTLKEKFKDKNIEIIGISVDENRQNWLDKVKAENLGGIQLYAAGWNNPLCEFFKITGIPRFILLDPQGKIINSNADRPSGNIEAVLNALEGI